MVRRHRAADAVAWNLSERRGRWRTRMQGLQGPGSPENRTLVTKTTTQAVDWAARSGEKPGFVA